MTSRSHHCSVYTSILSTLKDYENIQQYIKCACQNKWKQSIYQTVTQIWYKQKNKFTVLT
jgi:hypothetical protein